MNSNTKVLILLIIYSLICLVDIWWGAWYLGNGVGSSNNWAEGPVLVTGYFSGISSFVLFLHWLMRH